MWNGSWGTAIQLTKRQVESFPRLTSVLCSTALLACQALLQEGNYAECIRYLLWVNERTRSMSDDGSTLTRDALQVLLAVVYEEGASYLPGVEKDFGLKLQKKLENHVAAESAQSKKGPAALAPPSPSRGDTGELSRLQVRGFAVDAPPGDRWVVDWLHYAELLRARGHYTFATMCFDKSVRQATQLRLSDKQGVDSKGVRGKVAPAKRTRGVATAADWAMYGHCHFVCHDVETAVQYLWTHAHSMSPGELRFRKQLLRYDPDRFEPIFEAIDRCVSFVQSRFRGWLGRRAARQRRHASAEISFFGQAVVSVLRAWTERRGEQVGFNATMRAEVEWEVRRRHRDQQRRRRAATTIQAFGRRLLARKPAAQARARFQAKVAAMNKPERQAQLSAWYQWQADWLLKASRRHAAAKDWPRVADCLDAVLGATKSAANTRTLFYVPLSRVSEDRCRAAADAAMRATPWSADTRFCAVLTGKTPTQGVATVLRMTAETHLQLWIDSGAPEHKCVSMRW